MNVLRRMCTILIVASLFTPLSNAAPSDITWTDDTANNPVIGPPGFGDNRAYYGYVIFDANANIWRGWYDSSSGFDVGYAESTDADGTSWTGYALITGFNSDLQSKAVVAQIGDSQFRMWYMANTRDGGYAIWTAVSSDGVNWSDDQPISGIALDEEGTSRFGPVERISVTTLEDGSFVAYCRCEEPYLDEAFDYFDLGKKLFRYTSADGITWQWAGYTGVNEEEGFEGIEFSSAVKHPDLEGVWYAWATSQNSSGPIYSYISTDDGMTYQLDENPVAVVGELGTASYNADRNYHATVTYMGNGEWVMFRSVAEPKRTARATGVEDLPNTNVAEWSLF
ncbi:MAG: hypothetical protein P9L94_15190 [Candidatus Hinthialibacter antarcticus]|nr:hypothetical protein [Candidatus Hinthialibacter antarcticus]